MPHYTILTPVKRGGTIHRDTIELRAKEAAQLLASGAIEPTRKKHPPESAPATGPQAQAAGAGADAPGERASGQMTPAGARVTDTPNTPR